MFARSLALLLLLTLVAAVVARQSSGSEPARPYVVRPGDTLWSIAAAHYAGDPREGVWKLEHRNHLTADVIQPGERIVLP